jgi:hypothetical protein
MTAAVKKRKGSTSTQLGRVPMCKAMIACDGVNLVSVARERGYCNKCAEAAMKRGISLESK